MKSELEPKVIVGRNIRAERKRIAITQEALADRCGMHLVEIGRAERGKRDLRVSTITKIAGGLEVRPCVLLRDL